jgi:hypothetical protein
MIWDSTRASHNCPLAPLVGASEMLISGGHCYGCGATVTVVAAEEPRKRRPGKR